MRVFAAALIVASLASGAAGAQDTVAQPAAGPQATIETSMGNIVIALDAVHAPATVKNFIRYAHEKHFDGTVFYRVLPGNIIQAGSYNADGSFHGHANKPIPFEGGQPNLRGSVAMAHGDDPNSATAEFFIDMRDVPALDPAPGNTGFAVFGHVVSGMDVVDKINAVPLGGKGPFPPEATPASPVTIEHVTITE
jgi:peptidyl-prolyl cis-trans isomerase A (cyclophilin A)